MSIGIDSLMGSVNMSKLLDKDTLERGRVILYKDDVEKQNKEIVTAIAVPKKGTI